MLLHKQPSIGVLKEGVLKICSKFTGEHPCRRFFSIKLLCNFIEITLRHRCSLVDLLHIFRIPFYKNTYGGLFLLLSFYKSIDRTNCVSGIRTFQNEVAAHSRASSRGGLKMWNNGLVRPSSSDYITQKVIS